MEKKIIIIFLFLAISGYGQDLIGKYPDIQNEKFQIDNNKDSLNKIVFKNEEFMDRMTDGGGKLTAYYNENKEVRKIGVIVYKSTGVQAYDFYLKNKEPILVIDTFNRFAYNEKTNEFDYTKFDGGFSGSYLFENKKLIDLMSLGHNRFEDDQIDIEQTFLEEIEYYMNLINKRLPNSE